MKKHDEGYVLAYVTVVLLIFCLVATTILTGAMRNLQQQQDANQKMKDQYAAAGMIEQVLANWDENMTKTETYGVLIEEDGGLYTLTAVSGAVSIVCTVDENAKFLSYDVGAAVPTAPEEEVPG